MIDGYDDIPVFNPNEQTALATLSQGERAIAPLSAKARFSDPITRHHRPFYDDYDCAKNFIMQAIGDLSEMDVFGRRVLIAVFCRPNTMVVRRRDGSSGAIYLPVTEIKEDWWQNKAALILKCGPEAFLGDEKYHNLTFGEGVPVPRPGDWVFTNANSGTQMNLCGDGASRPQGIDARGEPYDIFEWDGWPCRMVKDEVIDGRLQRPHILV